MQHATRGHAVPLLAAALALGLSLPAQGSDTAPWPDYRGPHADGHAPAGASLPLEWSETQNVQWKVDVAPGCSSPIVDARGRVWLTTSESAGDKTFALSARAFALETGDEVRHVPLFEVPDRGKRHPDNSIASPSVVLAADGSMYVHFGSFGTACLEADGETVRWKREDLECDHGVGPGSSPVVVDDLVVLHMDGIDVQYVVALDRASGETRWKVDRSVAFGDKNVEMRKAYSTPLLVDSGAGAQLVSAGADALYGYDPATGDELWRIEAEGFSQAARPIVADGRVFFATGFMRSQLWALSLAALGTEEADPVAWKFTRRAPKVPSPVCVDGRLFLVDDEGMAACIDAASGESIWRQRLGGPCYASPLAAGDRVYFFDRHGRTTVVDATADRFEVLAKNDLAGAVKQVDSGFYASPAVVGDTLVLRSRAFLYRIGAVPE